MARVVHYQVVSASTGTSTGQGILQLVRDGRLVGMTFRWRATGGAGSGFYSAELGINSSSNAIAETGNPNRLLTPGAVTFTTPNGNPVAGNQFIPTNWPVRAGDSIALNQVQTGTAAASMAVIIDAFVEEAS